MMSETKNATGPSKPSGIYGNELGKNQSNLPTVSSSLNDGGGIGATEIAPKRVSASYSSPHCVMSHTAASAPNPPPLALRNSGCNKSLESAKPLSSVNNNTKVPVQYPVKPMLHGFSLPNVETNSSRQTSGVNISLIKGSEKQQEMNRMSSKTHTFNVPNTTESNFGRNTNNTSMKPVTSETPTQHKHFRPALLPKVPQHQMQNHPTNLGSPVRRGKWTSEEEAYAVAVIREFNSGYLDAPPGTTLRTFLSEKLQCDPMRITKKFTGDASIGKRVFHPATREPHNAKEIDDAQANLELLYQQWKLRLESQQEEYDRKSMAAAAVSSASSLCDNVGSGILYPSASTFVVGPPSTNANFNIGCIPMRGRGGGMRVPPEVMSSSIYTSSKNPQALLTEQKIIQDAISRTASWLARANLILSKKTIPAVTSETNKSSISDGKLQSTTSVPERAKGEHGEKSEYQKALESEMREISRLIQEGPAVIATSADLPRLLGKQPTDKMVHSSLEGGSTLAATTKPNPEKQTSSQMLANILSLSAVQFAPLQTQKNSAPEQHDTKTQPKLQPRPIVQSTVVKVEDRATSSSNPMALLASLSSHATPVPVVDDSGRRQNVVPQMVALPTGATIPTLNGPSDHDARTAKRPKLEVPPSTVQVPPNSYSTDKQNCAGNRSHQSNIEDAKTFVNFLQSVVHVKD